MPDWKAIQARSRANKKPTAKDFTVGDWMIACDYLTDERPELMDAEALGDWPKYPYPSSFSNKEIIGYSLRYVGEDVISAIAGRAPRCVPVRYRVGPGAMRTTFVFPMPFCVALATFLGLDVVRPRTGEYRYLSRWNRQSIFACALAHEIFNGEQ